MVGPLAIGGRPVAFLKIDPRVRTINVDLGSLGFRAGDVINVAIVGDFQATTDTTQPDSAPFRQDIFQNSSIFYEGAEVAYAPSGDPGEGGASGEITLGPNLSISVVNHDTLLGDNGDPDNDYGVLITVLKGPLFTLLDDAVNFGALTPSQAQSVAAGESLYNAMAGADFVVLPNKAGYQLAPNVTWDPLVYFNAGDGRDFVIGGDGNDGIVGSRDNDRLDGGAGNDRLDGGAGNDRLLGQDGHDLLLGRSRNDVLNGGTGDDTLVGGSGREFMKGESGDDHFVFHARSDTGVASRDVIVDFEHGDTIDLSTLDANITLRGNQSFAFVSDFTGSAGQLQWDATSSGFLVSGDVDGDATADFAIVVRTKVAKLFSFDFDL
jgi:Ca2+-binding RTX toxin-like protein